MVFLRHRLLACALGWAALAAQAQPVEDHTDHQRFACLQRERALEPLPAKRPDNHNSGTLRFKLRFTHPDEPPKVDLLHGQGDEDMEDLARRYLAGYRLPCLHAKDHPVEVVQEFSFSRWGRELPVLLPGAHPPPQIFMPKGVPKVPAFARFEYGKALVEISFLEGKAEPEVAFVFSSVGPRMQEAVMDHVRQFRLLDAGGRGFPVKVRQSYAFVDPETRSTRFRLRKDEFSLLEFLRMVGNLAEHPVDMDLGSMGCPFEVRLNLRQPYDANRAHQIDTLDPNRSHFLDWLSKLQPRFASQAQQMDLYGTDLRITVPCGRLNLTGLSQAGAQDRS